MTEQTDQAPPVVYITPIRRLSHFCMIHFSLSDACFLTDDVILYYQNKADNNDLNKIEVQTFDCRGGSG